MSKTMKRVSALLLAILMIVTYMPMMQETAYAAKAKKPAKVKWAAGYPKISGTNKNQLVLKWKKAKNAKKYVVSITHNGLTATKTTKKLTLTLKNCQYSSKYTVKVRGINGKKKGAFSVKKTKKFGADPKLTKALKEADTNKKLAEQLEKDLADAVKALETAKNNSEKQAEAVKQAQAIIDAYDNLTPTQQAEVPDSLKAAIEDARQAVKDAEIAAATELTHPDWDPNVKAALNALIDANKNQGKYVVFDFDNTCSIFDVEEQLAVHQLRTMSFVIKPEDMPAVLATELDPKYFYEKDAEGKPIAGTGTPVKYNADYCENKDARYDDWIDDITEAYKKLWTKYGPFTADGVDEATQAALLVDDDWKEFSAKIRTMYDLVYDTESAAVAYPWVLYWFTGMTEAQVYKLAHDSHSKYNAVNTERVKFETPEDSKTTTKIGRIGSWEKNDAGVEEFSTGQKFFNGTTVSDNIRELMAALDNNGIDVWVCSASATDPIRAAIDVWGLHDHVTGMMAMTNKLDADGKYIAAYDWEGGYAWKPVKGDATEKGWVKDTEKQMTQTQGKGKVIAIQNVLYPKYDDNGPIAGFMDSTGDFNFCTEFKDLEVVCCFNRADRKETDGGGVIAEVATYEKEVLGYDYDKARANDDTLYVLQGRDERNLRKLNPSDRTYVFKQGGNEGTTTYRFGSEYGRGNNETQYQYMIDNKMTVADAIDQFAIKQDAGPSEKNPFKFKVGFVTGEPGQGLGPKFHNDKYNPDDLDFSGYHSIGKGKGKEAAQLKLDSWNPVVKDALNEMMAANKDQGKYVVFDFDNTCSIFDVEEQLAVHQLRTMSFVIKPADMPAVLATELDKQYFYEKDAEGKPIAGTGKPVKYNADYCENKDARYDDWIDDISAAYEKLWTKYGPFTADGVDEATQAALLEDDDWKEFSAKIRTMYDLVYDTESAAVAYPWVLYWFTGMTEAQVYKLAHDSHSKYNAVNTERVKFVTPEESKTTTKIGRIGSWEKNDAGVEEFSTGQKFFNGTTVSDNIRELMKALDTNGIDVWVCSASATDPIRAAIDVWGLHDYVTGMMAMTNKLDADGKYIAAYDWEGGYAWKPVKGDATEKGWVKDTEKQMTQTQGKGKVIAIQNVLYPKYGNVGPIAGFMDSTGDYNFCTEFETLQVVCCFNRADRKETDGGGVIAEVATYENEVLNMTYATRGDDTLYVLQGRDERNLRKLNPSDRTNVFKQGGNEGTTTYRFGSEYGRGNNETQYQYMIDNKMTVADAINQFAIKQDAGPSEKNPFKFKVGFVTGEPGQGLGPKFHNDTYNPDDLDFSGYHSQK